MRKNWLWRYHEYISVKRSPVYEEKKDEAVKEFQSRRDDKEPNGKETGDR